MYFSSCGRWLKATDGASVQRNCLMTKKRGKRNPVTEEARLRKRLAIRILEYWYQDNYSERLRKFAVKASEYLKSLEKHQEDQEDQSEQ
jgi:hypothetical protein